MSPEYSSPRPIHLVLTRLASDAEPWIRWLKEKGIAASSAPCIAVQPIINEPFANRVKAELAKTTHVAVSSRQGAEAFRRLMDSNTLAQLPDVVSYSAVGPATADAMAWLGRPILRADPARAEGLLALLLKTVRPGASHVLLPAAKRGRRLVVDSLLVKGVSARVWPVYETIVLSDQESTLTFCEEATHVLFTSPSQVRGFVSRSAFPKTLAALSFGPSTTRALRSENIQVFGEVAQPTLEAVLALLNRKSR